MSNRKFYTLPVGQFLFNRTYSIHRDIDLIEDSYKYYIVAMVHGDIIYATVGLNAYIDPKQPGYTREPINDAFTRRRTNLFYTLSRRP